MNLGVNYSQFYDVLLRIRELFHSHGRIDDANAKLDEIIKVITLSYYEATKGVRFSLAFVKQYAANEFQDESQVAPALRELFANACKDKFFINDDGTCIFGSAPTLIIQPSENDFAERLITEIEKIDFVNLAVSGQLSDFDAINECFGHFVRDNFRNNKEDAQYMTPAEISNSILDMIFADILAEGYLKNINFSSFKIMDPTCGVGTLLIESAKRYIETIKTITGDGDEQIHEFLNTGVIGQDKVDRMVRLTKINALLLGSNTSNISIGNSISTKSPIDDYHRKIDLIFTNPPFGADYEIAQLDATMFSYLKELDPNGKYICSEILMLLKCIELLKPGGYLAIVLPDSIFSSKGVNEKVRDFILKNVEIKAVIELPAVTFAQAGTRTKTCICYLRKKTKPNDHKIVMAVCNDIGYTVKERIGVPVKILTEKNDLIQIAKSYIIRCEKNDEILNSDPSVTQIAYEALIDGILNPSFYSASRLQTLHTLSTTAHEGFSMYKLSDLVEFHSLSRKSYMTDEHTKHISVLHINPNCTIDFNEVENFNPISKGRECKTGDLIFSKINPRIPRMAVVPEYSKRLVCSNEFEIMRPISNTNVYALCLLLKSSYVRKQIEDLTSGTSSSHSRIKREQLANILIPYPDNQKTREAISVIGDEIAQAFNNIYMADQEIIEKIKHLEAYDLNLCSSS